MNELFGTIIDKYVNFEPAPVQTKLKLPQLKKIDKAAPPKLSLPKLKKV